jgi:membrane associated rhomboid family serine protease
MPGANLRPLVTWGLISANIIVWLMMTVAGGSTDTGVLLSFGAMFGPFVAEGEYWRLFTAMFLHAGGLHLAFNMIALWSFGGTVERLFGHYRFITLYVLAGLAGSVASYLLNHVSVAVGASGAVFGILGGLAAFFVTQRQLLGKMGQRNLTSILFLAAINLFIGFVVPGIDNWAHLGGLAGGFAIGYMLAPRYQVVRSELGMSARVIEAGRPFDRWWVVPVAVVVLAVGVFAGNATMPENAISLAYKAERSLEQDDYTAALAQAGRAIELAPAEGLAYYVRAKVNAELGNTEQAISDAGKAVQFGDRETREKAGALLVDLGTRR